MNRARLAPSPALLAVVRGLREAGRHAFAVGGAVRDGLLGLEPDDWDVATDAPPDAVQALFPRTFPVGVEHGTVGVRVGGETVEVTTFRTDVETFGRKATVRFGATLEEDLARRDFTINALAWDPIDDRVVDPFGGRADLAGGVLRTVGDPDRRIPEDYLRIVRAHRFAARFDLAIDPATEAALARHAHGVSALSSERVRDELMKTLEQARRASVALEGWRRSGILGRLLPELAVCFGVEQNRWHADDVGVHSLEVVDRVHPRHPLLRVVALLHDVGKPASRIRHPDTGDWTFPGHEKIGAALTAQALARLRFASRDVERATHLVRMHMDLFPADASDAAVRRWLRRVGPEHAWDLYRLHLADWWGNPVRAARPPDTLVAMYARVGAAFREAAAIRLSDLAIGGDDLLAIGWEPGPALGATLARLLERVVEDPSLNSRDALIALARAEAEAA